MTDHRMADQETPKPCNWNEVHEYVETYLDRYEFYGEDADGREGYYQPNERETMLINDAVQGLVGDPMFSALLARANRKLGDVREREGGCRYCGCGDGHWGNDCPQIEALLTPDDGDE